MSINKNGMISRNHARILRPYNFPDIVGAFEKTILFLITSRYALIPVVFNVIYRFTGVVENGLTG